MDASSVSGAMASVIGVFGATVAIANMDPAKRDWLWALWKKGLNSAFYAVLAVNSVAGIYLFAAASQPVTRWSVLLLLLHFFNICAGIVLLFMSAAEKALVARNSKRADLEAKVKELETQLSRSTTAFPRIETTTASAS